MLVLKRSLLNREWILANVLKALDSIISMYIVHVILLSEITQGIIRPFNARWASVGLSLVLKL
jgi:hypothetical protein